MRFNKESDQKPILSLKQMRSKSTRLHDEHAFFVLVSAILNDACTFYIFTKINFENRKRAKERKQL